MCLRQNWGEDGGRGNEIRNSRKGQIIVRSIQDTADKTQNLTEVPFLLLNVQTYSMAFIFLPVSPTSSRVSPATPQVQRLTCRQKLILLSPIHHGDQRTAQLRTLRQHRSEERTSQQTHPMRLRTKLTPGNKTIPSIKMSESQRRAYNLMMVPGS